MIERLAMVVVVMLALVGCRRAPKPPEPPAPEQSLAQDLWDNVQELTAGKRTNEVLQVLNDAAADPDLAPEKGAIILELVRLQLTWGRLDAARATYITALRDDPGLFDEVFGRPEDQLARLQKNAELVAWCREVLALEPESRISQTCVSYILEGLRRQDLMDEMRQCLGDAIRDYDVEYAAAAVRRVSSAMLRAAQHEELRTTLEKLAADHAGIAAVHEVVQQFYVKLLLAENALPEAISLYWEERDTFNEKTARALLEEIIAAARKKEQRPAAAELCKRVLDLEDVAPRLLERASYHYVVLAAESGAAAETVTRFNRVMTRGGTTASNYNILLRVFHDVVEAGGRQDRLAIMAQAERIREGLAEEEEQRYVTMLLLDGCYMLQDFDRALQIVEGGIPGLSESKLETLTTKIQAHRALAVNDIPGAVGWFRKFMQLIEGAGDEWQDNRDPMTGLWVSRPEVLGLNALRISDLWKQVGEADKAAAARAEGLAYYRQALEEAKKGSREEAALKAKLEELAPE